MHISYTLYKIWLYPLQDRCRGRAKKYVGISTFRPVKCISFKTQIVPTGSPRGVVFISVSRHQTHWYKNFLVRNLVQDFCT